jgi:hypothetical protein
MVASEHVGCAVRLERYDNVPAEGHAYDGLSEYDIYKLL